MSNLFLNHVNIGKLVCAVSSHQHNVQTQYDPNKIPTRFLEEVGKLIIINFMQKSYGSGIFKIFQ